MISTYFGKQLNLPDFLVIGAARSGTTALYSVLNRHPHIFMPGEKEPLFFCDYGEPRKKTIADGKIVDNWQNYNLDQYSDLFSSAGKGQLLGEASVLYLYEHRITIGNIKKIYQGDAAKVKIVAILRNPADRAWSHHLLHTTKYSEVLPFSEAIRPEVFIERRQANFIGMFDYLGVGLYAEQIDAWRKNFPLMKVWIYEEFFADLNRYMKELSEFLGVEPEESMFALKKINSSGIAKNRAAKFFIDHLQKPEGWKKPLKRFLPQRFRQKWKRNITQKLLQRQVMSPEQRRQLLEYYRPDIQKLETILDRDLDLWLKG